MVDKTTGKPYAPSTMDLQKPEEMFSSIGKISSIVRDWPEFDLALLKADFNKETGALRGKTEPDFLQLDFEVAPEGTEVYSFGYPLPEAKLLGRSEQAMTVGNVYCPRATSMIISSHDSFIRPMSRRDLPFPKYYAVDKALNPGNSGGPIVLQQTGKAIAVCSGFQYFDFPGTRIKVPSLYGITSSLKNIESELLKLI
jgi:serine protease Do